MKRLAIVLVAAATIIIPWAGILAAPGDLVLVSATGQGVKTNGETLSISISADGTRVAFSTTATNLDPRDTDPELDIYVKDLTTGALSLASTSASGAKGNSRSNAPSLSADGTKVAFVSGSRDHRSRFRLRRYAGVL